MQLFNKWKDEGARPSPSSSHNFEVSTFEEDNVDNLVDLFALLQTEKEYQAKPG